MGFKIVHKWTQNNFTRTQTENNWKYTKTTTKRHNTDTEKKKWLKTELNHNMCQPLVASQHSRSVHVPLWSEVVLLHRPALKQPENWPKITIKIKICTLLFKQQQRLMNLWVLFRAGGPLWWRAASITPVWHQHHHHHHHPLAEYVLCYLWALWWWPACCMHTCRWKSNCFKRSDWFKNPQRLWCQRFKLLSSDVWNVLKKFIFLFH